MAARSEDRRHAQQVELAMEIRSTALDQAGIDLREDAAMRRARTFVTGVIDALREQQALDALDDAKRDRVLELAAELAGLLDGVIVPVAVIA